MSSNPINKIVDYLYELLTLIKYKNDLRLKFLGNHTIHLHSLFRYLDKESKGYLTMMNLKEFCREFEFKISDEFLDFVINKFRTEDTSLHNVKEKCIDYENFLVLLLGKSNQHSYLLTNKTKQKFLLPKFTMKELALYIHLCS